MPLDGGRCVAMTDTVVVYSQRAAVFKASLLDLRMSVALPAVCPVAGLFGAIMSDLGQGHTGEVRELAVGGPAVDRLVSVGMDALCSVTCLRTDSRVLRCEHALVCLCS
jgi:hypothetical protein